MSQIEDLNLKTGELDKKADALQAAIVADKSADAKAVSDLTAENVALKANVADLEAKLAAIDPTAIQAAIDKMSGVEAKIDTATVAVSTPDA